VRKSVATIFVSAIVFTGVIVAAGIGAGSALGQSGICTVANTCSEAFFQCVATRCPATQSAACSGACKAQFDACKQTGEFGGADCRGKVLIRR
jgi:hypothetical protein